MLAYVLLDPWNDLQWNWNQIHRFSFKKMNLKTLSAKSPAFGIGLNLLIIHLLGPILLTKFDFNPGMDK